MRLIDKFESKYETVPESGCWLWTGGTDGKDGYGYLRVNGKTLRAHRISYELFIGPIPDGLMVCHRCDVPPCVNPAHLFVGTMSDNAKDCTKKGRQRLQKFPETHHNLVKTHCKHGHEFTPENTYTIDGHRKCRTCNRLRMGKK